MACFGTSCHLMSIGMKQHEEPQYVSAEFLARFFSMSRRTVERLAEEGVLKRHRISPRLVRFNLREVKAALLREEAVK